MIKPAGSNSISDLTFNTTGSGCSSATYAINLSSSPTTVSIKHNHFVGCLPSNYAVYLPSADTATYLDIEDNEFDVFQVAVYLTGTLNGAKINANIFEGGIDDISTNDTATVNYLTVTNNNASGGSGWNLYLGSSSTDVVVSGNVFNTSGKTINISGTAASVNVTGNLLDAGTVGIIVPAGTLTDLLISGNQDQQHHVGHPIHWHRRLGGGLVPRSPATTSTAVPRPPAGA